MCHKNNIKINYRREEKDTHFPKNRSLGTNTHIQYVQVCVKLNIYLFRHKNFQAAYATQWEVF